MSEATAPPKTDIRRADNPRERGKPPVAPPRLEGERDPGTPGTYRVFHPEHGAFEIAGVCSAKEAKEKWLRQQFPDACEDPEFVRCNLLFNMRAVRIPDAFLALPPGEAPPGLLNPNEKQRLVGMPKE